MSLPKPRTPEARGLLEGILIISVINIVLMILLHEYLFTVSWIFFVVMILIIFKHWRADKDKP